MLMVVAQQQFEARLFIICPLMNLPTGYFCNNPQNCVFSRSANTSRRASTFLAAGMPVEVSRYEQKN